MSIGKYNPLLCAGFMMVLLGLLAAPAVWGADAFTDYAAGYSHLCRGEFAPALPLAASAFHLSPQDSSTRDLYYQVLLANGLYERLVKAIQKARTEDPLNLELFYWLAETLYIDHNISAFHREFASFLKQIDEKDPEDILNRSLQARLRISYLSGQFDTYAEEAAKISNEEDKTFLKIAFLSLGDMEKAEAMTDLNAESDPYVCLLFWLGWLDNHRTQEATPWMTRAITYFDSQRRNEQTIARFLKKYDKQMVKGLQKMSIPPSGKRILYTVFAKLYPTERKRLIPMAEQMNFRFCFPHYFLEKILTGMKK